MKLQAVMAEKGKPECIVQLLCLSAAQAGKLFAPEFLEKGRIVRRKLTFHGKVPQVKKMSLNLCRRLQEGMRTS